MSKAKRICKILAVVLCCAIFTFISTAYVRYKVTINEKPLNEILTKIRSDENYVYMKDINEDFVHAVIAVEDPTFYEHNGVVLSNIMDAFFTNIKEKELVMGGSTITQQLSKNLYLDQRKTFHRKIAELFFVNDLESNLSKDEILEIYLNIIYFGDGYYGIKEASAGYFQTTPDKLTMAQATILAGLPQAPAVYQLSDGMELAKKRQRIVLEKMAEYNYLDPARISSVYNEALY